MLTGNVSEGVTVHPIPPERQAISCCKEELVEVELEALRQGTEQAHQDGEKCLTTMEAIARAATAACDRSLETQYLALDERVYRDVFTLAWCAGYHYEVRQRSAPTAAD